MRTQPVAQRSPLAEAATSWFGSFKNVFFPIFCKQCGVRLLTEDNGYFCPDCWDSSPRVTRPFCTACGKPHQQMVGYGAQSNFPCAACREKPNRQIRRVFAPALFEDAVAQAIKLFKFRGRERLAAPLGELLATFVLEELEPDQYDLLVPVPLHKVRLRARGFNQSRLLAVEIAPLFPKATLDESLQRIRPTRTQSRLRGPHRQSNVRGAFAVVGGGCQGKHVLLVDDVVTTMGTVTECAAALRRAGAASVDVLAVALTNKHWDPGEGPE